MGISVPVQIVAVVAAILIVSQSGAPAAVKWDYASRPVTVTENRKAPPPWYFYDIAYAFDGAGAQGAKPAASDAGSRGRPRGLARQL